MSETASPTAGARPRRTWRELVTESEIDTRLLGMVAALAVIWTGFHVMSDGKFITSRNLWNLSVQSTSIAIMATGMVLIIVTRNIDLSVGALLGFLGYTMALVQTDGLISVFGANITISGLAGHPWYAWLVALAVGLVLGAVIGGLQGYIVAYVGVPAFIVTLGGFLAWRGLIFRTGGKQGQTLAPLDDTFRYLGGAPVVLGVWLIAIKYPSPISGEPVGLAYPVLILIGITLLMGYLARRRRFGRYVYAYGGNPEAAELGGINTRRTITLTFVVMGMLCAVSAAIQTARLNSATTNLGVQNELDVIAAAVIGGTSFSGGIGTIPGAVLGAVVMQSLRSGMSLLNIDSPSQDIVVAVVLITAVAIDSLLRERRRTAVFVTLGVGVALAAIVIQTGRP
jgi:D-xylose transport system permease protein